MKRVKNKNKPINVVIGIIVFLSMIFILFLYFTNLNLAKKIVWFVMAFDLILFLIFSLINRVVNLGRRPVRIPYGVYKSKEPIKFWLLIGFIILLTLGFIIIGILLFNTV